MNTEARYNGWHNRATWNVSLWVSNTEHIYRNVLDTLNGRGQPVDARIAEKVIRPYFHGGKTPDGDKLSDCNWNEIADSLNEMLTDA